MVTTKLQRSQRWTMSSSLRVACIATWQMGHALGGIGLDCAFIAPEMSGTGDRGSITDVCVRAGTAARCVFAGLRSRCPGRRHSRAADRRKGDAKVTAAQSVDIQFRHSVDE